MTVPVAPPPRPGRRPPPLLLAAVILLVLLVGARLALPPVLKRSINQRLARIPAYRGSVQDIGVSLFRGAYTMTNLQLARRESGDQRPFFAVETLDFSIAWRELFHRRVVSQITAVRPRLAFVQGTNKSGDFDRRWQDVINDLFPIEITHLTVREGEIHFVAPARKPPVDVFLRHLHIEARGLRNRPDLNRDEPTATILVEGTTPGDGQLAMAGELEPLAPDPRLHVKLKVEKLSLPAINQFLLAYGNVDVSAGQFTGYLEVVARDRHYQGYFKPFFEHLDFTSPDDAHKSVFARLWEKIVAGMAKLVKNGDTEQVALRIPFSGDLDGSRVGRWESFRTLLRNGFIQALAEGLDGHPRPKDTTDQPPTPSHPDADVKPRPDRT